MEKNGWTQQRSLLKSALRGNQGELRFIQQDKLVFLSGHLRAGGEGNSWDGTNEKNGDGIRRPGAISYVKTQVMSGFRWVT